MRTGKPRKDLSYDQVTGMLSKAWNIFVNVDGEGGKKICPLPYQQLGNIQVNRQEVEKWDSYSSYDRLEEVKDQLSEEEIGLLIPVLLIIHGGNPDLKSSAFWDILQAHALNGHKFENMDEIWFTYKLRQGQSHLARSMFDEAVDFGLDYSFKTHVQALEQKDGLTQVCTGDGQVFHGRKVICTVPLNLLKSLKFDPPLSALRQEAVEVGHINFMTKIHAVTSGSGLASWNGTCYPNDLVCAYGDGVLPSGDVHLVVFGTDERSHFVPEEHPEKVVEALQNFHPMDVKKLVSRICRVIILHNLTMGPGLPQLEHRPIFASWTVLVATRLHVKVPRRAPETAREHLLRFGGLVSRLASLHRWST